jgi:basic membrane protein A and related proteins
VIRSLAAAVGVAILLCACAPPGPTVPTPSPAGFRVCLVPTTDGIRDGGINQLTLQGLQSSGVAVHVLQPATAADYPTDLLACVATSASLLVAVSASMGDAVNSVAARYPGNHFVLVDGQPLDASGQPSTLSNVLALAFDEKDAGYLVGALAGLLENARVGAATHNATGILGPGHTPAVDAYIAGFVAGARSVDARITIKLAYSDSSDADFCRQLGTQQIVSGADILFEVQDRCASGYIDAAYRSGVYAIGSGTDRAALSPAVITSAIKRIDRAVATVVAQIATGPFRPGVQTFGLDNDGTGFSTPSSVVPQSIINAVQDIRARIRSGAITPPDTVPPV